MNIEMLHVFLVAWIIASSIKDVVLGIRGAKKQIRYNGVDVVIGVLTLIFGLVIAGG